MVSTSGLTMSASVRIVSLLGEWSIAIDNNFENAKQRASPDQTCFRHVIDMGFAEEFVRSAVLAQSHFRVGALHQ